MTVRFHVEAQRELGAAARAYEIAREGLGKALTRAVAERLQDVERMPVIASRVRDVDLDVLRVSLRRFPYSLVFLRPDRDLVLVIAVAHHRRAPGYWLGRVGG